jgi:uncharacterized membrane protein YkvA (DUF1232 family)
MTSVQADLELTSNKTAPVQQEPDVQGLDLSAIPVEAEVVGNPVLDRFWAAIRRLPKYLRLAANMARDGRVPNSAKAALAVGGIYTISPVDLVPGIIPVAGQLDDLAVLLFALRTAIRACPPDVAAAHLERVGLSATDFDGDLDSVRETIQWLATKGYRASKKFAIRSGHRIAGLWKTYVRPA